MVEPVAFPPLNWTEPPEMANFSWPAIFGPLATPAPRPFWNLYLLGPIGILACCVLWIALWLVYRFCWRKIRASCCEPTEDERRPLIINDNGYLEAAQANGALGDLEDGSVHLSVENEGLLRVPRIRAIMTLTPKEDTFDISFSELGLKLHSGAIVLEGVTGVLEHGKTTAIMGPSGSGKTTFLTALAGRATYGKDMGIVKINGKPDSLSRFKKLVGYVPQEDTMHGTLTVKETLMFSALTRLPREMKYKTKENIVQEVMELLDIAHIQDSIIGDETTRGISGGQRKRVNIGIELVSDPSILLLDEPTSGLDSSASKSVCQCLQALAGSLGITVALVLHQPRYEVFEMFDNVLLLGKGGRTVYLGPAKGALPYFENLGFKCPPHVNPADFLLDIIAGEVNLDGSDSPFNPASLFKTWEDYVLAKKENADPINAAMLDVMSIQQDDPPEEKRKYGFHKRPKMHLGSVYDLVSMFIAGLIIPLGVTLALYHEKKSKSLRWRYGAYTGATTALVVIFFMVPYFMRFFQFAPTQLTTSVAFVSATLFVIDGLYVILFVVLVILYLRRNDGGTTVGRLLQFSPHTSFHTEWIGHFLAGSVFGPFWMMGTWSHPKITPHSRYASVVGFGAFVLMLGLVLVGGNLGAFELWEIFLLSLAPILGIVMLIVFALRYQRLPTFDRATPGFFYQIWLVFKRSITQQFREWVGIVFDLFLVVAAGSFLGVIYFDRNYSGPLIDAFLPQGGCPKHQIPEICSFLYLPRDDPIAGEASLTCLAIGLAAMTSSLRVFGAEKVVFRRESRSGLMTEAYYLGKMLAHLPTLIIAPSCFLACYYSLKLPLAPFYEYLLLFFAVYFACASFSYLISIVVPPNIAQLAGVLLVLIFMMFSGANPTLKQLKENTIIPAHVLFFPSYGSLFRWSQELYYLIEVAPYHPSNETLGNLFSYNSADYLMCWGFIIWLICLFRFATYVSLVVKEGK